MSTATYHRQRRAALRAAMTRDIVLCQAPGCARPAHKHPWNNGKGAWLHVCSCACFERLMAMREGA